jgi:hypothetical protein
VIGADLVLQFVQPGDHFDEACRPNGLEDLQFVIKALNSDAPLVVGIVITVPESAPHPFAALTVNSSYSRLDGLPFVLRNPQKVKVPSCLVQVQRCHRHRLAHIGLRRVVFPKPG